MLEFDNLKAIQGFINSGKMRMLYLSRPACGVCTAIKPKLMEILNKYPAIESAYINMDLIPESAGEYSIFTIPGILFFIDGKEVIREARYISLEEIETRIERYYNMLFSH
jgi:thiol-disulfide isomerase/thioredoxin